MPVDMDVIAATLRAGPECVSLELAAEFPGGLQKVIVSAPDWDPYYGETAWFAQPLHLPAGTIICSTFRYNNSASNPRNPFDPPDRVNLARRTGIASFILHGAVNSDEDANILRTENLRLIRARQRPDRGV